MNWATPDFEDIALSITTVPQVVTTIVAIPGNSTNPSCCPLRTTSS
jgi:hypothetical protein